MAHSKQEVLNGRNIQDVAVGAIYCECEGQRSAVVIGINDWKQLLQWLGSEQNMPEAREGLTQMEIAGQQKENSEALKRAEIVGGHE